MEFDFLSIVVWAIVGGILGSLIGILFQDGRFDLSGDVIGSLIGGIGGGLAFEWMVGDISSLVGSSLAASIGALIFLLLLRLTGTQPHDRTDDAMTQLDNQINLENGGARSDEYRETTATPNMNATGKTIEIDVENAVSGRDIPDTQMAPQETEVDVMATIPDVGTPEVPISREETKTEEESVILNVDVDSSTNRDTDRSNVSLSQEETKTVVVDAPEVDVDVPSVDTDVSNESEDSVGDFVVSKSNYPDDLTQIKGIGLVYQERLNENNIYTWDQVANLPVEQLKDVTKAIDAAKVDAWAQQALDLAQKNNRIGARYNGPLPDRLSKIPGIGKQTEQTLRQGGIFTYSQLANSTPGELNAVLPTPRDEQDLMAWITGAATMVDDG